MLDSQGRATALDILFQIRQLPVQLSSPVNIIRLVLINPYSTCSTYSTSTHTTSAIFNQNTEITDFNLSTLNINNSRFPVKSVSHIWPFSSYRIYKEIRNIFADPIVKKNLFSILYLFGSVQAQHNGTQVRHVTTFVILNIVKKEKMCVVYTKSILIYEINSDYLSSRVVNWIV